MESRRDKDSRKIDLSDICRLKCDPSLIGHVSRTYYDVDTHAPLDQFMVLLRVPIPPDLLVPFLKTGAPPKGYVFLEFSELAQGGTLAHEDDLELISRSLGLGEVVKRDLKDTISGTVISTSRKCSLEPVAYRTLDSISGEYGPLQFTQKAVKDIDSAPEKDGPPLLHDVPVSELRNYENFSEGDYIVYRQKLGIIQQIDRDVVLLLQNQTAVSPLDPTTLQIPLSIGSSAILSLPNNPDAIGSIPLEDGKSAWSMESEPLYPGQFASTSASNLRTGHWIFGAYSESERPEGHVIATPAMDIHVDWLCPNIFAVGFPYRGPNSEVIRASTLQGQAVKCDFGKTPSNSPKENTVKSDVWLDIGDRVRFRDPADAISKYPQYQPIPTDQTMGHDLNVFQVISTRTEVTVQWQDRSVTVEDSTAVRKSRESDDDVWPGDFVVLRDGVETVPMHSDSDRGPRHAGRHRCKKLRPNKIGVVQSVDGRERIASVRWYENPDLELLHGGNILRSSSRLGELSHTIEDVSLYELNSYPGLSRSLDDLVLLAPEKVHQSLVSTDTVPQPGMGPCQLSFLYPSTFFEVCMYLELIKQGLVTADWFKETTEVDSAPLPPRFSVHREEYSLKSPVDFVGRIVARNADGTIIVRLAGADNCRDICVPMERILMVVDYDNSLPLPSFPMLPPFDLLGLGSFGSEPAAGPPFVDESDDLDDSEDDEWMTEDESDDSYDDEDPEEDEEVEEEIDTDKFVEPEIAEITPDKSDLEEDGDCKASEGIFEENKLSIHSLPSAVPCPPSFEVSEGPPPSDHHFLSKSASQVTGMRLKRIRKEFEILESSLPPGIYVRSWESRIDLMRVLIIGPSETPYEHAPFVIDFRFSQDYPNSPPTSFFHSWTNGLGMVNPNLYEDGKICLSILGTWPTKNPEESWSPIKSTILQILVSLMGLVLVKTPFYNEAGYEAFAAEDNNRVESAQYTEKAFLMTRKFITYALEHPISGFEDILAWNYLPSANSTDGDRPGLLKRAIEEARAMIEHHNNTSSNQELDEDSAASVFIPRLSLGAVVMLRKHLTALEKVQTELTAEQ